jgi:tetratricopeptide (TPR) repeat protein
VALKEAPLKLLLALFLALSSTAAADTYREHANNGDTARRQGRNAEAMDEYTKALEVFPNSIPTLKNRADIYMKMKDFGQAAADYAKVIALKEDNPFTYADLATCLGHLEKWEEAKGILDQAIALRPSLPSSYLQRAGLHLTLYELDPAAQDCRKAMELDPRNFLSHMIYADVLDRQEKTEEALLELQKASELMPENPGIFAMRAHILWRSCRHEKALEELDKALRLNGKYRQAYDTQAMVLADLHRWGKAQEAQEESERLGQPGASALPKAKIYFQQGDLGNAQKELDELDGEKLPHPIDYYRLKLRILREKKRDLDDVQAKAVDALKKEVLSRPRHPGPRRDLAMVLADSGASPKEALALAQEALDLDPGSQSHFTMGVVLLGVGKAAEALPHLKMAEAARPCDDDAALWLGKAYRAAGDLKQAKRVWQANLKSKPGDRWIKSELSRSP